MESIYESAKDTAKKIRKELKKVFPAVKFSVRSDTYSMGSSVSVRWTDGPMEKEVQKVCDRFESASFDGMQDMKISKGYMYEGKLYSGADYVSASRTVSPEYKQKIIEKAIELFGELEESIFLYNDQIEKAEYALKGLSHPRMIDNELDEKEIVSTAPEEKAEKEQPKKTTAKIINFQEKKEEKFQNSLTAEQRLKLLTLETMFEDKGESLQALFDRGLTIDNIFTAFAKTLFNEKAIR